jgi:hypothetical protein
MGKRGSAGVSSPLHIRWRWRPSAEALALLLLLAVYITLGVSYLMATPLFENPDEWSHLSVIRYFIHQRAIPPRVLPERTMSDENMAWFFSYHDPPLYYTPPLYHALSATFLSALGCDMADLPDMMIPSPVWERGWTPEPGPDPRNKTMFAHRAEETWTQSETVRATVLLRVASLGLGAVTAACAYLLAWLLSPERAGRRFVAPGLGLGAAALVALNPKFLSVSAAVTNDNLINAIFAAFLVGALWLRRSPACSGSTWRGWAALGGLAGLGLMTKQSALLLLPVGGLAILWQRDERRHARWRRILVNGLAFSAAAFGVGGWWYVRNLALYGDPLGLETHFAAQTPLSGFGMQSVWMTLRSYWAAFGWAPILVAPWMYAFAGGVALAALAGLLGLAARGRPASLPVDERRALLLLISALALNVISFYRWAISTGAPTGRLLFPTLPVVAVLAAQGLGWWGGEWRWSQWGRWALTVVAGGALFCAAVIPWRYLRPAYASPRVSPETLAGADLQPVGDEDQPLEFAGGVRLAAYDIGQGPSPGRPFDLTVYWRAETRPAQQYRVWVQLAPQDPTERVAEADFWLGGARYPSDLWPAGDAVRQTFRLAIPAWAPAPVLYWARIGLLDETGARVDLADGSSDMVVLGPWRMRAERDQPAAGVIDVDFRLGSRIRLIGYRVERSGDDWIVTLYWRAEDAVTVDYAAFVHLLDEQGRLIAQHDGPPRDGAYPTSWWLPGDVTPDRRRLSPERPFDGAARLAVGMYDPATMDRLPAYNDAGERLPDDVIPLTEFPKE